MPDGAVYLDLTGDEVAVEIKPKVEPDAASESTLCVRCNHPIVSTDPTMMLDGNLELCNFCTMCAGPVHIWIRCEQCPVGAACSHQISECEVHSRVICLNCLEVLGGYGSPRYDLMVHLIRRQVDIGECINQDNYDFFLQHP